MELMSSLLLCVLATMLPQTYGKSRIKPGPVLEIKFNNSLLIQQKPTLRKKILLNINGPPLVTNSNQLQSVYNDVTCKMCQNCMDRSIKAYKIHTDMHNNRPSAEELQEDVLTNDIRYRTKRDVQPTNQTIVETPTETVSVSVNVPETKTTRKVKTRRNKMNKSVTVTKYNMDGEVYALRVKETQVMEASNDSSPLATCQVYNVKKSYPCDSPESDALLAAARRKANKRKTKKLEQDKIKTSPLTTTARVRIQTSNYRKREVDNSQVPENFMPSIEELY